MNIIVNVDKNWNIGYKGNLLLRFKEDMDFFKQKTVGNICIMGRNTLESFPNKMPLSDRENLVLTNNKNKYEEAYKNINNIKFFNSKENIIKYASKIVEKNPEKEIYIIGGQKIYEMFLEDASTIYVTQMEKVFTADVSFPNLNKNKNFTIKSQTDILHNEKHDLDYRMIIYEKIRN